MSELLPKPANLAKVADLAKTDKSRQQERVQEAQKVVPPQAPPQRPDKPAPAPATPVTAERGRPDRLAAALMALAGKSGGVAGPLVRTPTGGVAVRQAEEKAPVPETRSILGQLRHTGRAAEVLAELTGSAVTAHAVGHPAQVQEVLQNALAEGRPVLASGGDDNAGPGAPGDDGQPRRGRGAVVQVLAVISDPAGALVCLAGGGTTQTVALTEFCARYRELAVGEPDSRSPSA